eukprot:CAMPEP_0114455398 /NCGR_PEP_ID=MMETSP0104-20121206/3079_1 /TAXON_ID=37642 ORGANISM="Paraphysomonas imperforata, Strain PA2" /NCGR_SAMPLE_ID=MMETSP0104 /ASSEMBLY_ACC=CAM_ASM_000202 /LENGTH=429 /DNA_ID=CAMNT_0001627817 /DNA_START=57 /DNA_END=1346 /DNA_ORIENTATION=+
MKPHLSHVALDHWGVNTKIFSPLIEVESYFVENPESTLPIVLIGNVFKDLTLRPSVLTDEKENDKFYESMSNLKKDYYSDSDKIYLEDESGRIELISENSEWLANLVTGVTIAVLGLANENGQFQVTDSCTAYPTFTETDEASGSALDDEDSSFVLLVSGLEFGATLLSSTTENESVDEVASLELSAQMLADFVSGRLGGEDHARLASRIGRVIVAGNSINSASRTLAKARTVNAKNQNDMKDFSKQLDLFLFQVLGSCPVDVMPGSLDPSNNSMPQQPLNACFTPNSNRFSTFTSTTNPYDVTLTTQGDERILLGHAGTPVDDIARQVPKKSPVDILKDTLSWGNACPTAPDTLPSYPFRDIDPFVIESSHLPHIFFAGNQDEFESKLVTSSSGHQTRLVCIPKFSTTREAVLVNLKTLKCEVLRFGI